MSKTYHRPPLTFIAEHLGSESPWIPVDQAFRLLGLRLHELEDRKTFEYFVSSIVRYAVRLEDGWHEACGPYQVGIDGSLDGYLPTTRVFNMQAYNEGFERFQAEQKQRNDGTFMLKYDSLSILMRTQFPSFESFSSDPSDYLISAADCERILKASPYLFDSLAFNAWRVGTHEIYPLVKSSQLQKLPPFPGAPIKGERGSVLNYRRNAARYKSESSLNLWAESIEDPAVVLSRFKRHFKRLGDAIDHIVLLSESWMFREAGKTSQPVEISPLFIVVDERVLEPRFRGRWWFEHNVSRLQAYEEGAEASRDVTFELIRDQAEISQNRHLRFLAQRALELGMPEAPLFPKGAQHIRDYPNMLFTGIASRQRAVLRSNLKHRRLQQSLFCSLCGVETTKRSDKRQGRKSKYCIDCCKYALSLERQMLRQANRRRRPWHFTNKPRQ